MRALLIATGYRPEIGPLLQHRPTPLLYIAGKPIIMHIMEFLAQQGIKRCNIVLHHLPKSIEDCLGDGKRWGIAITYHLAKDPDQPLSAIQPAIPQWEEDKLLLGTGDTLPRFTLNDIASPSLLMYPSQIWSGWGVLPKHMIIKDLILKNIHQKIDTEPYLSAQNFRDLQATAQLLISGHLPKHYFPITMQATQPHTWVCRSASLDTQARLIPPVFIGENCLIKKGATIGPNAIVECNSIIDNYSTIENTMICPNSYVGESLEVRNSIVDRNLLVNLSWNAQVLIEDDFLLGETSDSSFKRRLGSLVEKCMASTAFLLFLPFFLLMLCSHSIDTKEYLLLPSPRGKRLWKTFSWLTFKPRYRHTKRSRFFRRLPVLINIIRGEAHFFGVAPRSYEEVEQLPKDWRNLYLCSKVGLITLADLDGANDSDSLYASEAYYASQMGWRTDVRLFLRWLKQKIARKL